MKRYIKVNVVVVWVLFSFLAMGVERLSGQDAGGAGVGAKVNGLEVEMRQLQRDYIELQKRMLDSGVGPRMQEDLKKLDSINGLEKRMEELAKENEAFKQWVKTQRKTEAEIRAGGEKEKSEEGVLESVLGVNTIWVLMAAFLVMLMQAGFALVECGFTRKKNAAHTMVMNVLDYGVGMLVFWAFGFAFMFGNVGGIEAIGLDEGVLSSGVGFTVGEEFYGLLGSAGYFLWGEGMLSGGVFTLFLFQMVFAATANTICTGTLAERWKISAFCLSSVLVTGVIYPIFGSWVWGGGWLSAIGFSDFAGSVVVHMTGGVVALVGAKVVGARVGKFNEDGSSNPIPGHNLPMAVLGTFLLAFGWFGFNAGSSLSGTDGSIGIIAVNTALASAAGMVGAIITSRVKFGVPDLSFACNGMLAGLVGITAGCAFVDPWAAVAIGAIAGVLVVFSALWVEETLGLDDPVGAISVHGTCGAWGGVAVGLWANGSGGVAGLFYGDGGQFLVQCLGVIVNIVFIGSVSWVAFMGIEKWVGNRASDSAQEEGLDVSEMGVEAYGD